MFVVGSGPGRTEVIAQAGYFNAKPFSEYTELEKRLHLIDLALADMPLYQDPVRFPMMAMASSEEKEGNLCLAARIPVKKIQEISGKKVELIDLILDAQDNISELHRTLADFSKFSNENAFYYSFLSLPSGSYRCRVVVRNLETGKGAVGASTVIIPAQKDKGIQLFPFLLLTPEKNSLYLRGYIPDRLAEKAEKVTLSDHYSFDPRQYSPYLDKTLIRNSELWAVFRCSIINIPNPEVHFAAFFKEKISGQEIPVELQVLEEIKAKDSVICFVKFKMPEIIPGSYLLSFMAGEKSSGSNSQVATDYTIK